MNTILKVCFNNHLKEIIIENILRFPCEGETFNCNWRDFTTDKDIIKYGREADENSCLYVHVLGTHYRKNKTTLTIVLFEGEDYKEYINKYLNR